MPRVNFDEIDDSKQPWEVLVEPGTYCMKISAVKEEFNKGRTEWKVQLEHLNEPYFVCTDWLYFIPSALNRLKILYKALDLPHNGDMDCKPEDIQGREVLVHLIQKADQNGKVRMKPDFRGYESVYGEKELKNNSTQSDAKPANKDEEIPF